MIYLGLAILCSASIALLFRVSESANRHRYAVTSVNYLAACSVSAALIALRGVPDESSSAEIGRALLLGAGAGSFFFLGFLYYQISVRAHGVALSGAFAKLGILVPMSLSLVLWREYPSGLQWIGIALAVGSILLVHWPGRDRTRTKLGAALLLLFVFGGLAEFSNKVFQKYGVVELRDVFLMATFAVALLTSLGGTLRSKRRPDRADILTGVAVGIPNLFSSWFLILALDRLPAPVAFAGFGAGTLLVLQAAGVLLFRERPDPRERIAIFATTAALVFVNL